MPSNLSLYCGCLLLDPLSSFRWRISKIQIYLREWTSFILVLKGYALTLRPWPAGPRADKLFVVGKLNKSFCNIFLVLLNMKYVMIFCVPGSRVTDIHCVIFLLSSDCVYIESRRPNTPYFICSIQEFKLVSAIFSYAWLRLSTSSWNWVTI